MSTWQATGSLTNASDASFRAWIARVHAALAACGMVQTSDTGQIDTSTVTVPGTATYAGSSMWRFNDALQSTSPVFFKLDFGTAGTAGWPAMRISVGQGSNGACALTGSIIYSNKVVIYSNGASANIYPWYACGNGGRFLLVMALNSSYTRAALCLERGLNASGAAVADDIRLAIGNYSTPPYWTTYYLKPSSAYSFGGILPLAAAPSSGSGSWGNNIGLFPIRFACPAELSPLIGMAAYFDANITAGTPISVTGWDGNSHTYLPLGNNIAGASPTYGGATVVAILWE